MFNCVCVCVCACVFRYGDVNPSGRLALTFPNTENEIGFTKEQWPGVPVKTGLQSTYTEKLEVGYRYYDSHSITPKFPFGALPLLLPLPLPLPAPLPLLLSAGNEWVIRIIGCVCVYIYISQKQLLAWWLACTRTHDSFVIHHRLLIIALCDVCGDADVPVPLYTYTDLSLSLSNPHYGCVRI
eukprot:COSAG05_NODE_57_length_23291_cov_75.862668_10_plen_183_part_00